MSLVAGNHRKTQTWQVEYNPDGKPGRKYHKPKLLKDGSVPEKVIQRQILDWLRDTGFLHWRQNSGTVFAGNRRIHLGDDGLPDIVIILPPNGRVLGLEVKSAKGRLRPGQVKFRERVLAVGGSYHVVRTLQQAMSAVATEAGKEHLWCKQVPSLNQGSSSSAPN